MLFLLTAGGCAHPDPPSRGGSRCPWSPGGTSAVGQTLTGSPPCRHPVTPSPIIWSLGHHCFSETGKNKVFKIQEDISAKQGLGEDSPCGRINSRQQRMETEHQRREARSPCPWVSLVEIKLAGKSHRLKLFGSFLGDHESAGGSVRFSEYIEPALRASGLAIRTM